MSEPAEDLWPIDIGTMEGDRPPLVVLREQAAMLGKKTQNLIEAEVTAEPWGNQLKLSFTLIAPALSNYRYDLLEARQPATLYPVTVTTSSKHYEVNTEEELRQILRDVFNSATTKRVINGLIAQSKS